MENKRIKFYMVRWQLDKKDMPNNYVEGYEVFTNKKEAIREVEFLKKIHFYDNLKVNEYSFEPWQLSEFVSKNPERTKKTNYGYVENKGFQFH